MTNKKDPSEDSMDRRDFLQIGAALAAGAVAGPAAAQARRRPATPAPAPVAPTVEPAPEPLVSFATPVAGEPVISPWGLRRLPWERQGRPHAGVDIAAPSGAPIASVAARSSRYWMTL